MSVGKDVQYASIRRKRFRCEKDRLWKEIIKSKYGGQRELNDNLDDKYDSLWWIDNRKLC